MSGKHARRPRGRHRGLPAFLIKDKNRDDEVRKVLLENELFQLKALLIGGPILGLYAYLADRFGWWFFG